MARSKIVLPGLDVAKIRRYGAAKVPPEHHDEIRIEVDTRGWTVTILECRAPWREDFGPEWTRFPVARLKYDPAHEDWVLYWRDRNTRWHLYDLVKPARHVDALLAEIDADRTGIFWG